MIYGYARVSTDGQRSPLRWAARRKHEAGKVFREVAGATRPTRRNFAAARRRIAAGSEERLSRSRSLRPTRRSSGQFVRKALASASSGRSGAAGLLSATSF
jgi:hypothetical protein